MQAQKVAPHLHGLKPSTELFFFFIYILVNQIIYGSAKDEVENSLVKRLIFRSLLEDGKFAKQFLDHRIDLWKPMMLSSLKEAVNQKHLYLDIRPDEHLIWLSHHLSAGISLYSLPKKNVIQYKISHEKLVQESILFMFRGMGFKPEVIQRYYEAKKFNEMKKELDL